MRNICAIKTPDFRRVSKIPPCPRKNATKRPIEKESIPSTDKVPELIPNEEAIFVDRIPNDVRDMKLVVIRRPAIAAITHLYGDFSSGVNETVPDNCFEYS